MSTESLTELSSINKAFQTDDVETHALAEVNLNIVKGEYVSISGPSGCGKSRLLSILGLLDTPTTGTYTLNGAAVAGLSAKQRAKIRNDEIGFIFQAFNFIGDMTVYENVALPLTYRSLSSIEIRSKVGSALEKVGMDHRTKHYPAQLSGGQQQRVAVARAVVGEPTGNLDSKNGEAVMNILQSLHSLGSTNCMVTHDPRYAESAQRSMNLFDGSVEQKPALAGVAS